MQNDHPQFHTAIKESDSFQPDANAPKWFLDNLQRPGDSLYTLVSQRSLHMLTWNWERSELPTLLLVHGYGAHAHWWSYLAPFFCDHYRVIALSGG